MSTDVMSNTDDVMTFVDDQVDHSKVYWYRIMSATENNVSSPLTAPVRAFMPRREVLPAPEFTVDSKTFLLAELKVDGNSIAEDSTTEQNIDRVTIDLKTENYKLIKDYNLFGKTKEIDDLTFTSMTEQAVVYFYSGDLLRKSYTFALNEVFDMSGNAEEGYQISGMHHLVNLRSIEERHIDGGFSIGNCQTIKYTDDYYAKLIARGGCIETTTRIGLNRYHKSTECSPVKEFELCTEQTKRGDLISNRMIECLPSGICSQPTYLNYVLLDDTSVPNAPTLSRFNVLKDELKATMTFVPQLEKVKGTMLNLYKQKDEKNFYTKIVAHIGNKSVEPIEEEIGEIGPVEYGDTWCLKAKTIGLNGKVSKWSAPLCQDIIEEGSLPPEMLAWPTIANTVSNDQNFTIQFDEESKQIAITLINTVKNKDDACSAMIGAINSVSDFVVYRQSIHDDGSKSKFVQVSPLIEAGTCKDDTYNLSNNLSIVDILEESTIDVKFIDRYPYVLGEKYQYVILFFDGQSKEMKSYALTYPTVVETH